jgi:hypothetical protein
MNGRSDVVMDIEDYEHLSYIRGIMLEDVTLLKPASVGIDQRSAYGWKGYWEEFRISVVNSKLIAAR